MSQEPDPHKVITCRGLPPTYTAQFEGSPEPTERDGIYWMALETKPIALDSLETDESRAALAEEFNNLLKLILKAEPKINPCGFRVQWLNILNSHSNPHSERGWFRIVVTGRKNEREPFPEKRSVDGFRSAAFEIPFSVIGDQPTNESLSCFAEGIASGLNSAIDSMGQINLGAIVFDCSARFLNEPNSDRLRIIMDAYAWPEQ